MSSASGHQSRFLCPRVPPVNGQLPVFLSSVFASMSLLLSCACILRLVLEREAARGANGDQGSSVSASSSSPTGAARACPAPTCRVLLLPFVDGRADALRWPLMRFAGGPLLVLTGNP